MTGSRVGLYENGAIMENRAAASVPMIVYANIVDDPDDCKTVNDSNNNINCNIANKNERIDKCFEEYNGKESAKSQSSFNKIPSNCYTDVPLPVTKIAYAHPKCVNNNDHNYLSSQVVVVNRQQMQQVPAISDLTNSPLPIHNTDDGFNNPHHHYHLQQNQHHLHHNNEYLLQSNSVVSLTSSSPSSIDTNNSNNKQVKQEQLSPTAPNGDHIEKSGLRATKDEHFPRSRSTTPSSYREISPQLSGQGRSPSENNLLPIHNLSTNLLNSLQEATASSNHQKISGVITPLSVSTVTDSTVTAAAALQSFAMGPSSGSLLTMPPDFATRNYSDFMRCLAAKYNNTMINETPRRSTFFGSVTPAAANIHLKNHLSVYKSSPFASSTAATIASTSTPSNIFNNDASLPTVMASPISNHHLHSQRQHHIPNQLQQQHTTTSDQSNSRQTSLSSNDSPQKPNIPLLTTDKLAAESRGSGLSPLVTTLLSTLPFGQGVLPLIDMSSTQALFTLARAVKETEFQKSLRCMTPRKRMSQSSNINLNGIIGQNGRSISTTATNLTSVPNAHVSVALQQAAQLVTPALIYANQLQQQSATSVAASRVPSRSSAPLQCTHCSTVSDRFSEPLDSVNELTSIHINKTVAPLDLSSQAPISKRFKAENMTPTLNESTNDLSDKIVATTMPTSRRCYRQSSTSTTATTPSPPPYTSVKIAEPTEITEKHHIIIDPNQSTLSCSSSSLLLKLKNSQQTLVNNISTTNSSAAFTPIGYTMRSSDGISSTLNTVSSAASKSTTLMHNSKLQNDARVNVSTNLTIHYCQAQSEEVNSWSIDDVCNFVGSIDICAEYIKNFRDQRIDGSGLPLLTDDHLINMLGMKLGPALKLRSLLSKKLGGSCPCVACTTQTQHMLALQTASTTTVPPLKDGISTTVAMVSSSSKVIANSPERTSEISNPIENSNCKEKSMATLFMIDTSRSMTFPEGEHTCNYHSTEEISTDSATIGNKKKGMIKNAPISQFSEKYSIRSGNAQQTALAYAEEDRNIGSIHVPNTSKDNKIVSSKSNGSSFDCNNISSRDTISSNDKNCVLDALRPHETIRITKQAEATVILAEAKRISN